jgi:predicted RNA-binding Zn ribbon-like protein
MQREKMLLCVTIKCMFVGPLPVADLVALVNDWGTRPREVGRRGAPSVVPPSAASARQATVVADRLHAVFVADDPAERAAAVTGMLTETGVRPELATAGDALLASWRVPRRRDALLASAALALWDQLAAHPDRIGACADAQCADVYVDASPAGHRRFCSLTCQNRTRVAAFRQRRRETTS